MNTMTSQERAAEIGILIADIKEIARAADSEGLARGPAFRAIERLAQTALEIGGGDVDMPLLSCVKEGCHSVTSLVSVGE